MCIRDRFHVLADDETLDLQPGHQDQLRVGHRDRLAVVAGDHAAHRDAAEGVHAPHHRVEDPAADILEVPIDTVGAGFLPRPRQALGVQVGLLIDAGIKTEFATRLGTIFRPTGRRLFITPEPAEGRSMVKHGGGGYLRTNKT